MLLAEPHFVLEGQLSALLCGGWVDMMCWLVDKC